jgi:hypothetical protein
MKIKLLMLLIFICVSQGCTVILGYRYHVDINQHDRRQLKKMNFKKTFDQSKTGILDSHAIYFHHSKDESIDMEFNFIIRFFETGQYAFFARNVSPIIGLSHEDIDYNDLKRATYVGYYNIKKDFVIIEYPNHLFRRGGIRNIDKYKVLPNGDLKSITKIASDYGAVYNKIPLSENDLINVAPDW